MLIEQAVFTSAQTDWSAGYRLVSTSPGLRDVDAQELSNWGPSHDSLWEEEADASSVNFHRLPSGAFCVSRTTPAGSEYSGRRGPQIYTQCLVVGADLLARFSNNPFALLRAVVAQGSLRVYDPVPPRMTPIRLVGRAAPFDQALVGQLADDPGIAWLATTIQALIDEPRLGLMVGSNGQRIVQGLFNLLPPECRTEFSFATGLRYSPRRPFRLACLPPAKAEARRLERRYDLRVLDLSGEPPREFEPRDGWACFVGAALARRKAAWFGSQLAHSRPELDLDGLNSLGRRLLAQMSGPTVDEPPPVTKQHDTAAGAWLERIDDDLRRQPEDRGVWQAWQQAHREAIERGDLVRAADFVRRACEIVAKSRIAPGDAAERIRELLRVQLEGPPAALERTVEALATLTPETGRDAWLALASQAQVEPRRADLLPFPAACAAHEGEHAAERRADAPHQRFAGQSGAMAQQMARDSWDETPADILGPSHPAAVRNLEQLDDTVFEAIAGKAAALEELRLLWPETLRRLGPEAIGESREQYLRHALSVWRQCIEGEEVRDPRRAIRALDVLAVLYEQ